MNDSELWISGSDEDEEVDVDSSFVDPSYFQLGLGLKGQSGDAKKKKDFKTKNDPTKPKQRKIVTGYNAGSRKRPAFYLGCEAKVIIHGALKDATPATLLVYDFEFFSYRSVRIKKANIHFEFRNQVGIPGAGPLVSKMTPFATHTMMQTTATVTSKRELSGGLSGGGAGVNAQGGVKQERTVEQVEAFAAEITGNHPPDDFGNRFRVSWSLRENDAQPKGIVRQLRACILLTRNTEETFTLVPTIEVEPDFKTWVGTLFSSRPEDDPVVFDPAFEPLDELSLGIDQWNLDAVPLDQIWDCTFHRSFGDAVKSSKEGSC